MRAPQRGRMPVADADDGEGAEGVGAKTTVRAGTSAAAGMQGERAPLQRTPVAEDESCGRGVSRAIAKAGALKR